MKKFKKFLYFLMAFIPFSLMGQTLSISDVYVPTVYSTDNRAECLVTIRCIGASAENPVEATISGMKWHEWLYSLSNKIPSNKILEMWDSNFFEIGNAHHTFTSSTDTVFTATVYANGQDMMDLIKNYQSEEYFQVRFKNRRYNIPLILKSPTQNVIIENKSVYLSPQVADPVLSVNVDYDACHVTKIYRGDLVDGKLGPTIEPEVYLSIPCKNEYGFSVKFKKAIASVGLVNEYNYSGNHQDYLVNIKDQDAFTFNEESENINEVYFAPGVTKVRMPLTFFTDKMDPEDESIFVRGFMLEPATNSKVGIDMEWNDWDEVIPEAVKLGVKLPTNPENPQIPYHFFVGYQVTSEQNGLEEAERIDDAEVIGYYGLSGRRYDEPRRGVNIVRYSDGSARKILK